MKQSEIKQLQKALRETVAPAITVDGVYGAETTKAIALFANTSGISSEEALKLLDRYADQRFVSDEAFVQAAETLGVKESYVRAVAEVESRGESFLSDGRVKILFERHWFYRKLKEALANPAVQSRVANRFRMIVPTTKAVEALLAAVVGNDNTLCYPTRGAYKGGGAEWTRLNEAMDYDVEAACQSASFGGYQIMGFNCVAAGYKSAKDMMLTMAASESAQFLAVCKFIKANPQMHKHLKNGNWAGFAELYNGSDYKSNYYDTKLSVAEKKWTIALA